MIPSSTSTSCRFFAMGHPRPGGSKKAFPLWRGKGSNRQFIRTLVTDASGPKGKQWREVVAWEAKQAMAGREPMAGPLEVEFTFLMPRPKSHMLRGRVRNGAPWYPIGKPDALKLARSVEDALTGIVWWDDSQVVCEHIDKRYANDNETPGVVVEVRTVGTTPTTTSNSQLQTDPATPQG